MTSSLRHSTRAALLVAATTLALLTLAACGGGGGGGPTATMPPGNGDGTGSTGGTQVPVASSQSVAATALPVAGSVTQSSDVSQGMTASSVTASVSLDSTGHLSADVRSDAGWRVQSRDPDFVFGARRFIFIIQPQSDGSGRHVLVATDRERLPADPDYLVFGYWEHIPGKYLTTEGLFLRDLFWGDEGFSAQYYKEIEHGWFVNGNDPFEQANVGPLTGSATYGGDGFAVYVDTNVDPASNLGKEDLLTFDVSLTANFGGSSENGTVSGLLSGFRSTYEPVPEDDPDYALNLDSLISSLYHNAPRTLTLQSAPIGNSHSGFFTGDTAMTFDGSSFAGKWGGQFYGNGDADGKPGSTAGTFGAATSDGSKAILGAFGAHKR